MVVSSVVLWTNYDALMRYTFSPPSFSASIWRFVSHDSSCGTIANARAWIPAGLVTRDRFSSRFSGTGVYAWVEWATIQDAYTGCAKYALPHCDARGRAAEDRVTTPILYILNYTSHPAEARIYSSSVSLVAEGKSSTTEISWPIFTCS